MHNFMTSFHKNGYFEETLSNTRKKGSGGENTINNEVSKAKKKFEKNLNCRSKFRVDYHLIKNTSRPGWVSLSARSAFAVCANSKLSQTSVNKCFYM